MSHFTRVIRTPAVLLALGAVLSALALLVAIGGAANIPDSDFGRNGVVTIAFPPRTGSIQISELGDQRLVVSGMAYDFTPAGLTVSTSLLRVLADGTLDQGFGVNGVLSISVQEKRRDRNGFRPRS